MSTTPSTGTVSRRTTVAALSAAGLGLALTAGPSTAQDPGIAEHPMVGTWLVRTPDGSLGINYVRADGTWAHTGAPLSPAPDGTVTYQSLQSGVWEPDLENERGIHFVSVQGLYDETGVYSGTFIIDGYPSVSEDGQTQSDDWSRTVMTTRDANDIVINELQLDPSTPPIAGVLLAPGALIFPPLHATGATPES